MKLKVQIKENEYFIKLLSFLNNIPPFNELTKQELHVLAALLELNYKYRKVPFLERSKLLFSTASRKVIVKMLDIHYNNLYNLLQRLRSKGFIQMDKGQIILNPKYALDKTATLTVLFEDEE